MHFFIQLIYCVITVMAMVLWVRYNTHMFQLNSYQYRSHGRFIKTHLLQNFYPLLLWICGFVQILNGGILFDILIWLIVIGGMIYLYLPRAAKKKLVYTKRVQRLLITTIIAHSILILLGKWGTDFPLHMIVLIVGGVSGWLVLLANICNQPIEKGINQYYINQAKKMLKESPNLKIIGITGSYGKTSVKYYLHTLLSAKYNVLMTPESFNTPLGIVRTIRGSLKATHEIFLCEMGARHVGDIKEICDIVSPHMGIITSLGYQHLETFKSIENVVGTKKELFDSLESKAPRFVNGDNEFVKKFGVNQDAITYGLEDTNDYQAFDLIYSEKGAKFKVKAPDGTIEEFQTQLLGEHNVINITGAIAIAHYMKISMDKLRLPVRRLEGAPHRLQPIAKSGNITIIDDAYNSNPNGALMALKTLGMFQGLKILVTPGMVELGEMEDKYNYEFGVNATKYCDYIVLIGKKQTESIKKAVEEKGFPAEKFYVAENLADGLNYVYEIRTESKKIVLLENDLPDNYL